MDKIIIFLGMLANLLALMHLAINIDARLSELIEVLKAITGKEDE